MKYCARCGLKKSKTKFYRCATKQDGLQTYCKPCCNEQNAKWRKANPESRREVARRVHKRRREKANEARRAWNKTPAGRAHKKRYTERISNNGKRHERCLKQYGLTPLQYENLVLSQNRGCAICDRPAEDSRHGKLHVDHCHETGKVRGLLCDKCNLALGGFNDSQDLLRKAAQYIGRAWKRNWKN